MRMEYAKRMFFGRDIVAEHEIQLVLAVPFARDRRDRIVRLAVRLRINKCRLIGVASPRQQNLICKVNQTLRLLGTNPDDGHRPLYDPGFHILITRKRNRLLDRCFRHRKLVMTALEMIMTQDRSTDDRKICIRTDKVMRKLRYKIQQLCKSCALNLHRHMLRIEHDAVLVIVDIR